jgi:hypothetical protein
MSLVSTAGSGARAVAVALLASALCVACSSASDGEVRAAAPSSSGSAGATASATVPATPSTSPTAVPSFDRTAPPATTSGSLRRASLPRAAVLGPGWRARVDGGSTEDGYTGNGTPSVARDPQDLILAVRPIGCAEEEVYAEALPLPRYALEVDYRHRSTGANGVGIALEFADAASAARFVEVYSRSLGLCRSGAGGTTRVTREADPGSDALATVTVDPIEQTRWRELTERSGRVVRLLAVEGSGTPVRPWPEVLAALRAA